MTTNYTKLPLIIPNRHKILQTTIKYNNIVHSKALQNVPESGFLVWKQTIWQPLGGSEPTTPTFVAVGAVLSAATGRAVVERVEVVVGGRIKLVDRLVPRSQRFRELKKCNHLLRHCPKKFSCLHNTGARVTR
jgi:hypothetical protein